MQKEKKDLDQIAAVLSEAKKIALICHVTPDGDTVGSALALYAALKKIGKAVDVFSSDPIGEKLKYLPFSDKFNINVNHSAIYDAAVAVDCGTKGRLGDMFGIFNSAAVKICLDHHKDNNLICDYSYVDPQISSTAEIVFLLLKRFPDKCLDKNVAALIYAGIISDSGLFSYSSTTAQTHNIAAELYNAGIDASDIAYNIYKKKSKPAFLLANKVLGRTRFFFDDRVGLAVFFLDDFAETGAGQDATEGVVNAIQSVTSVLIAVTLTEIEHNKFRVSIRSKEPAEASAVAAEFGGGGHRLAAGCRLSGPVEEVIERIVKAAGDFLPTE
ncbi:MAG: bifunctional oligoribonuclease/PAP phosphatase NrnA [Clostridiales bacterium]|jgi:phosphoesterase RecJ-like protein|nr:bifunctional oligoribonuclease/PAP phosphatase NrnA [Clostridiales bacterium]